MAEINELHCVDIIPGSAKYGLKRGRNTTSAVIVNGDLLDNLTLFVKYKNGRGPTWQGALTSTLTAGSWKATLTCTVSNSPEDLGEQVGDGDGEPEDVPVTVSAGTNLANPQVTNNTVVVPVG